MSKCLQDCKHCCATCLAWLTCILFLLILALSPVGVLVVVHPCHASSGITFASTSTTTTVVPPEKFDGLIYGTMLPLEFRDGYTEECDPWSSNFNIRNDFQRKPVFPTSRYSSTMGLFLCIWFSGKLFCSFIFATQLPVPSPLKWSLTNPNRIDTFELWDNIGETDDRVKKLNKILTRTDKFQHRQTEQLNQFEFLPGDMLVDIQNEGIIVSVMSVNYESQMIKLISDVNMEELDPIHFGTEMEGYRHLFKARERFNTRNPHGLRVKDQVVKDQVIHEVTKIPHPFSFDSNIIQCALRPEGSDKDVILHLSSDGFTKRLEQGPVVDVEEVGMTEMLRMTRARNEKPRAGRLVNLFDAYGDCKLCVDSADGEGVDADSPSVIEIIPELWTFNLPKLRAFIRKQMNAPATVMNMRMMWSKRVGILIFMCLTAEAVAETIITGSVFGIWTNKKVNFWWLISDPRNFFLTFRIETFPHHFLYKLCRIGVLCINAKQMLRGYLGRRFELATRLVIGSFLLSEATFLPMFFVTILPSASIFIICRNGWLGEKIGKIVNRPYTLLFLAVGTFCWVLLIDTAVQWRMLDLYGTCTYLCPYSKIALFPKSIDIIPEIFNSPFCFVLSIMFAIFLVSLLVGLTGTSHAFLNDRTIIHWWICCCQGEKIKYFDINASVDKLDEAFGKTQKMTCRHLCEKLQTGMCEKLQKGKNWTMRRLRNMCTWFATGDMLPLSAPLLAAGQS